MKIYTSKTYYGEGTGIIFSISNFIIDIYLSESFRFSFGNEPDYADFYIWFGPFALEVTQNEKT